MKRLTLFLAVAIITVLLGSCKNNDIEIPSYKITAKACADFYQSTVVKVSPLCNQDGTVISSDKIPVGNVLLVMSQSKEMLECETLRIENHQFDTACTFYISNEKRSLDRQYWYYVEYQAPYSEPIRSDVFVLPAVPRNSFMLENGEFIQFAPGNLQYKASTNTWRFAEHQYDIIGEDNNNISPTYNGYIDLFGYGTSGYKYQPYSYDLQSSLYANGSISNTNDDWGVYCNISNGGNYKWRTLDNNDWNYIIWFRPNAGKKQGLARVDGVLGYIFLPDAWTQPIDCPFYHNDFHAVELSLSEWQSMENAGAVFLPAAGYRIKNNVNGLQETEEMGFYYTSTWTNGNSDYSAQPVRLYFAENDMMGNIVRNDVSSAIKDIVFYGTGSYGGYGNSVRLVKTVQESSSSNAPKRAVDRIVPRAITLQ